MWWNIALEKIVNQTLKCYVCVFTSLTEYETKFTFLLLFSQSAFNRQYACLVYLVCSEIYTFNYSQICHMWLSMGLSKKVTYDRESFNPGQYKVSVLLKIFAYYLIVLYVEKHSKISSCK
jgi:hypothetical protein